MTDRTTLLTELARGIRELADLAEASQRASAQASAQQLQAIVQQLGALPAPTPAAAVRSQRDNRVEKCPRCTIRSLRAAGEQRSTETGPQTRFQCTSCGYEEWRE